MHRHRRRSPARPSRGLPSTRPSRTASKSACSRRGPASVMPGGTEVRPERRRPRRGRWTAGTSGTRTTRPGAPGPAARTVEGRGGAREQASPRHGGRQAGAAQAAPRHVGRRSRAQPDSGRDREPARLTHSAPTQDGSARRGRFNASPHESTSANDEPPAWRPAVLRSTGWHGGHPAAPATPRRDFGMMGRSLSRTSLGGGGGSRTRVLQSVDGASPSAAGVRSRALLLHRQKVEDPSQLGCPLGPADAAFR